MWFIYLTLSALLVILLIGVIGLIAAISEPRYVKLEIVTAQQVSSDNDSPPIEVPEFVKDYINQESDDWARISRTASAKRKYNKLQNWQEVLIELKKEDL